MADIRRPKKPGPGSSGAGEPSSVRRSRPAPRPARKTAPVWLKIGLIVSPLLLLGLALNLRKPKEEVAPIAKAPVDPNARVKELEKQVEGIRNEYKTWRKLLEKEDPTARSKQEALVGHLEKWIEEWDTIFDARRDKDGRLPPDLQSYQRTRAGVNQLRSDILKSSEL